MRGRNERHMALWYRGCYTEHSLKRQLSLLMGLGRHFKLPVPWIRPIGYRGKVVDRQTRNRSGARSSWAVCSMTIENYANIINVVAPAAPSSTSVRSSSADDYACALINTNLENDQDSTFNSNTMLINIRYIKRLTSCTELKHGTVDSKSSSPWCEIRKVRCRHHTGSETRSWGNSSESKGSCTKSRGLEDTEIWHVGRDVPSHPWRRYFWRCRRTRWRCNWF